VRESDGYRVAIDSIQPEVLDVLRRTNRASITTRLLIGFMGARAYDDYGAVIIESNCPPIEIADEVVGGKTSDKVIGDAEGVLELLWLLLTTLVAGVRPRQDLMVKNRSYATNSPS
jgi:hypothetical protein